MIKNEHKKNAVYGIIGLVALFLVGAIFGFIINGSDRINHSSMTEKQCEEISNRITRALDNYDYNTVEKLNKLYSENCLNRIFRKSKPQQNTIVNTIKTKLPEATCAAVEHLLKNELHDEDSMDSYNHYDNARVYEKLAKRGCVNNRENYAKLAKREQEIAEALNNSDEFEFNNSGNLENQPTCEQIETLLTGQLNKYRDMAYAQDRVQRAQIYANLSERGCPENSEKYKELARQELEIARALTDDDIEHNEREATEMVETYKRLQMQAEAAKMIEKAKKLTNPAIDFIIQLEKIIEE